ncbi:hypothetical protein ABIB42_002415 [Massilia sp. UYP32]
MATSASVTGRACTSGGAALKLVPILEATG